MPRTRKRRTRKRRSKKRITYKMEELTSEIEKLNINYTTDEDLLKELNNGTSKLKPELVNIAKQRKIPNYYTMNKSELISSIKNNILGRKYYNVFAKIINMRRYNIDRLYVTVPRLYIQGGNTNEDFGKNIYDWRLQHHYPTTYVCNWKKYENKDEKFYDIMNVEGKKAEGKNMTDGITLTPSRDTGANRKFDEENLNKCLNTNNHYFFLLLFYLQHS